LAEPEVRFRLYLNLNILQGCAFFIIAVIDGFSGTACRIELQRAAKVKLAERGE
jgi:hypothetical protein